MSDTYALKQEKDKLISIILTGFFLVAAVPILYYCVKSTFFDIPHKGKRPTEVKEIYDLTGDGVNDLSVRLPNGVNVLMPGVRTKDGTVYLSLEKHLEENPEFDYKEAERKLNEKE